MSQVRRITGGEDEFVELMKNLQRRVDSLETRGTGSIHISGQLTTVDPFTGAETIFGALPDGSFGLQEWVGDITPPNQPSAPVVSPSSAIFEISWNGLDTVGGEMPADFDRTIVEMATTASGPWTEVNYLQAAGRVVIGDQPTKVDRFFRLISIDKNGNRSVPSSTASGQLTPYMESPEMTEWIGGVEQEVRDAENAAVAAQGAAEASQNTANTLLDGLANSVPYGDLELAGLDKLFTTSSYTLGNNSANAHSKAHYAETVVSATSDKGMDLPDIPVTAGRRYRVTFWMWANSDITGNAGMPMRWLLSNLTVHNNAADWGAYSRADRTNQVVGQWFKVEEDVIAPENSTHMRPRFYVWKGAAPEGTIVRFDDFVVRDVTEAIKAQETADLAAAAALAAAESADLAQDAADGKSTVWYLDTAPTGTAHKAGDIWFDKANGNKPMIWEVDANGVGSWVGATDTTYLADYNSLSSKVDTVQESADGKNTNYRQGTAPLDSTEKPLVPGDIWFNTADNNKPKVWTIVNGTGQWVGTEDTSYVSVINETNSNVTKAQSTADRKNTIYTGPTAPPAPTGGFKVGDTWFDTANKNEPKTWSGSAWLSARDATIADANSLAAAAKSLADEHVVALQNQDLALQDLSDVQDQLVIDLDTAEGVIDDTKNKLGEWDLAGGTVASKLSTVESTANTAASNASTAISNAQSAQDAAEAAQKQVEVLIASADSLVIGGDFETDQEGYAGYREIVASPYSGSYALVMPSDQWRGATFPKVGVRPGMVLRGSLFHRSYPSNTVGTQTSLRYTLHHDNGTTETKFATTTTNVVAGNEWTEAVYEFDEIPTGVSYITPAVAVTGASVTGAYNTNGAETIIDLVRLIDSASYKAAMEAATAAQQEAEAARDEADAAMVKAGQALDSANGKNTVTNTTGEPPLVGKAVGDIHFKTANNTIVGQWMWDGTQWVSQTVDSEVIANLDVGKLTGVFANIAQHLEAGSINSNLITVGIGQNLIPNGNGAQDPKIKPGASFVWDAAKSAWTFNTYNSWNRMGHPAFPIQPYVDPATTKQIPQYRLVVEAYTETAGTDFAVALDWHTNAAISDTTYLGRQYPVWPKSMPTNVWNKYEYVFNTPTAYKDARAISFQVIPAHTAGTAQGKQWFKFSLQELTPGNLIVNGTITGTQIDAESVAAKVGEFSNLIVTEGAIMNHLTVIEGIAADEIAAAKISTTQITAGTANIETAVIDKLFAETFATKKLTADNIVVSSSANMILDPKMSDVNVWGNATRLASQGTGKNGYGSFLVESGTGQRGGYTNGLTNRAYRIRVVPGATYRVGGWARTATVAPANSLTIYVRWYNSAGSFYSPIDAGARNAEPTVANTWKEFSKLMTVPDGYDEALIGIYVQVGYEGAARFSDLYFQNAVSDVLIADGAVTADKIAANSITATNGKIASLDASKITFGEMDGKYIQAGTISAEKLLVGFGGNLIVNGDGRAREGWEEFGHNVSGPTVNNGNFGSFWIKNTATKSTKRLPITPGTYRFTASVKGEHTGGKTYVQAAFYDKAGVYISGPNVLSNVDVTTTWNTYVADLVVPAGATQFQLNVYGNHTNGTVVDDYMWYTGFDLRAKVDGKLIVNGSISADHLNLKTATIDSSIIGSINASVITVGEMSGDRIKANTIGADKLIVGMGDNLVPYKRQINPTTGLEDIHHNLVGVNGSTYTIDRSSTGPFGGANTYFNNSTIVSGTMTEAVHIGFGMPARNGISPAITVVPGQTYIYELYTKLGGSYTSGSPTVQLATRFRDSAGAIISTPSKTAATTVGWSWTLEQFEVTVPANAASMTLIVSWDKPGVVRIGDPSLRIMSDATIIKQGSITTPKIAVGAITADSGIVGSLDAGVITVGEMDAARIKAGSITADKLVVGQGDNLISAPDFPAPVAPVAKTSTTPEVFQNLTDARINRATAGMTWVSPNRIGWNKTTSSTTQHALYLGNMVSDINKQTIPVIGGRRYTVTYRVYSDVASSTVGTRAAVNWLKEDGTASYVAAEPTAPAADMVDATYTKIKSAGMSTEYVYEITAPDDAIFMRVDLQFNGHHGAGRLDFMRPAVRLMTDGTIITKNAISTENIKVGAITGSTIDMEYIKGGIVTADMFTASNAGSFSGPIWTGGVHNEATFQTTISSERGVKMTKFGFFAYSGSGEEMVKITNTGDAYFKGKIVVGSDSTVAKEAVNGLTGTGSIEENASLAKTWVVPGTTTIDGAKIATGSVEAGQLKVTGLGKKLMDNGELNTPTTGLNGVKITTDGIAAYDSAGNISVAINADGSAQFKGAITVVAGSGSSIAGSTVTGTVPTGVIPTGLNPNVISGLDQTKIDSYNSTTSRVAGWSHIQDSTVIDGGKIYTGSITADKILVGTSANMLPNPDYSRINTSGQAVGFEKFTLNTDATLNTGQPLSRSIAATKTTTTDAYFEVVPGAKYSVSMWMKASVAGARFYWQFLTSGVSSNPYVEWNHVLTTTKTYFDTTNTQWNKYTGSFVMPAGATGARLNMYAMHPNGANPGTMYFGEMEVRPLVGGTFIDAGSVGTSLLTSGAMQTHAESNKGVKITNSGIKAYDSTSSTIPVFDLASATGTLTMQGTYRTDAMPTDAGTVKPALVIKHQRETGTGNQLGVWFTTDGRAPGDSGYVAGRVAGIWMDPPDNVLSAYALNIRGQAGGGVTLWGTNLTINAPDTATEVPINALGKKLVVTGNAGLQLNGYNAKSSLYSTHDVEVTSNNILYNTGTNGAVHKTNGYIAFRRTDNSPYSVGSAGLDQTTSSGANMHLSTVDGRIFRSTSSMRYKKFISDFTPDPNGVLSLQPRKWRDKNEVEKGMDKAYYVGFVAEEVEKVYPELVVYNIDENGNKIVDGVQYDRITTVLVAKIKEQEKRLQTLENIVLNGNMAVRNQ